MASAPQNLVTVLDLPPEISPTYGLVYMIYALPIYSQLLRAWKEITFSSSLRFVADAFQQNLKDIEIY
jgi:hypothetical protein